MKTVVQRVTRAAVHVDGEVVGAIQRGLLLLVGVQRDDAEADADATAAKIAGLRCFPGRTPMDRTVADVEGGCLVVSQFTLAGSVRKGNRPSFTGAEDPERACALYERVIAQLADRGISVATGRFRADMQIDLVNDGPITLLVFTSDGKVL